MSKNKLTGLLFWAALIGLFLAFPTAFSDLVLRAGDAIQSFLGGLQH